ncbi:multi-sensor signal transduction histidine kinase [Actinoplanes sp. SE50]|uniref:sensor histidine kinase n=1 Tax=unclassified Actinoplanes TaxID=2626549 RepID=UPI00023ECED6|nr:MULTISPECIES: ATP-binding protein [unclassified Actinoplanes]AEV85507.1 multi-sensor signal transduction histidine kinase [Actinoplanes sp. SE50/110]ATO83900.1 multi-sensor signal transduction histidine kinase [Actinoplanes sp. SE50]SLM01310.1 multi-sensor signal transduction histidine kinase [Actinoplanes sp. SE50/110]
MSADTEIPDSQAVLAAALDAYLAFDATGRVVAWNPAAETTFGYPRAQAVGRSIEELIVAPGAREAGRAELALLTSGQPGQTRNRRRQWSAWHADGHEIPIEMTLTATDSATGRLFHIFAHDITAEHRAGRFTAVEAAVARGLAEADSSDTAAERVVEALGVKMGWPVTELWVVDDDRQLLNCLARHVEPGRRLHNFAVDTLELGVALPGRVCAEGTPQWIPDLTADTGSLRSRAGARIGLRVAVGVPLCTGQHVFGALCVYGNRVEDPEDTLIALLSGLAAQIGQYVQRRRAEELTIELARTKDEFLAMVTHELRSPLAAITGTASLLDDEIDDLSPDERHHYLRMITRNAERLSVMAEDLLDLARLESGSLGISPVGTDLCEIIRQSLQAVTPADKDLTIVARLPERLDLYADPGRLRQVADNLLSNAVKYTPEGGTVTVTAAMDDSAETVTWTVADTGIGIPSAERPRLFRRFYRASTALDRRIPGTGLGLVIARAIVERHRGTITLADHSGPGTTFAIELPVKPAPG